MHLLKDTLLSKAQFGALWVVLTFVIFVPPSKKLALVDAATGGGSMLGDVNISAILDSFSISYDKRVRPNYGGKNL
ncbi:hypothetical protein DMENIID0001_100190 [Sergentomyia squamirostris]